MVGVVLGRAVGGADQGAAAHPHILSGVATTFSGMDYVYVVVGDSAGAASVYRIID